MSIVLQGDGEIMVVDTIDDIEEVEFNILPAEGEDENRCFWIDKDQAIELIEHLKQQFSIGGES